MTQITSPGQTRQTAREIWCAIERKRDRTGRWLPGRTVGPPRRTASVARSLARSASQSVGPAAGSPPWDRRAAPLRCREPPRPRPWQKGAGGRHGNFVLRITTTSRSWLALSVTPGDLSHLIQLRGVQVRGFPCCKTHRRREIAFPDEYGPLRCAAGWTSTSRFVHELP